MTADLSNEQLQQLSDVWWALADAPHTQAGSEILTARMAEILAAPIAILRREGDGWALASSAPPHGVLPDPRLLAGLIDTSPRRGEPVSVDVPGLVPTRWTAVPIGLREHPAWLLLVPYDWSSWPPRAWIERFARELSVALRLTDLAAGVRRGDELVLSGYAFSRRLAETRDEETLHQLIVDTLAGAVRAEQAALAVYEPQDGRLRIAATRGYPQVLVDHVRVAPGSGVIGGVFGSRKPLLVADMDRVSGLHARRPRYRTASFLTVPLLAADETLGVVSLADREDGRPFGRRDLTVARALAAPAALGLARERLTIRTRELARAATVDPLTGLFNRRYFHTRLEEEIERARRYGLDLAVLILDIDNFKTLNDTLGHLVGDIVLRDIGDILHTAVRVFDVCTRYGGEEFAVLMPGANPASAALTADRIRQRIESYRPATVAFPRDLRVTVSVGLSVFSGDLTAHDLMGRADRALYLAKAEGKNRVRHLSAGLP